MTTLQDAYAQLQIRHGASSRATKPSEQLVVQLVDLLLDFALTMRAGDIHLEPTRQTVRVRYRIDGLLHEQLSLPKEVGDLVIRSIKVRAEMATEMVGRSKPQDGRINFQAHGATLDIRLSSFPTLYGDVLALRVLDHTAVRLKLEELGLVPELLHSFEQLLRRPNGLVLVTGPANSGKPTTLYSALERLVSPHVKIMTLEDPVEYQMENISQAQISPQSGLTFASGLRAILRQDANVILVGEIRDRETAEISTRAALTGHLVLATLHTRHSCGAVIRLTDMGIEPHLMVASTSGILAQRLVRRVCPACAIHDEMASKVFARLWHHETGAQAPEADPGGFRRGKGCDACNGTGYQGRLGLFELLMLTDPLKRLILDRSTGSLYRAAVEHGMRSMLLDGLLKASKGQTTVEEVMRVTGETEAF